MILASIRPALAAIVASTTGIPAASVFWGTRPRGWTGPIYAVLRLESVVAVGRDSVRYDYDVARPLGAEIVPTADGIRSATWIVQVWSHSALDASDALQAVLALRDRLHMDTVRDALQAVHVGIGAVLGSRNLDVTQDGREMSVAQIDIGINATSTATDTPIGYVEQWGVEGEATLADGTTETIVGPGVYP